MTLFALDSTLNLESQLI